MFHSLLVKEFILQGYLGPFPVRPDYEHNSFIPFSNSTFIITNNLLLLLEAV